MVNTNDENDLLHLNIWSPQGATLVLNRYYDRNVCCLNNKKMGKFKIWVTAMRTCDLAMISDLEGREGWKRGVRDYVGYFNALPH